MNDVYSQLYGDDGSERNQLLYYASEIEQKFSIGRARDIRPEFVQTIIDLSLNLQGKTNNDSLVKHLAQIQYTAYAALDNVSNPNYYMYLQVLSNQLQSLTEF